jgi:hypothetical protein
MKNKSAVEWLFEQLDISQGYESAIEIFQQAKEMEKQQIVETWHNGYENQSPMIDEDNCGEQYYNETFKNK